MVRNKKSTQPLGEEFGPDTYSGPFCASLENLLVWNKMNDNDKVALFLSVEYR